MLGVMYVKCQAGCVSLFPEERFNFPPPDGVVADGLDDFGVISEHRREEGVEPCEGGAAEHGLDSEVNDLPF